MNWGAKSQLRDVEIKLGHFKFTFLVDDKMSEPVTYKKYLPVCSIPQNCIISKFVTFAPRA